MKKTTVKIFFILIASTTLGSCFAKKKTAQNTNNNSQEQSREGNNTPPSANDIFAQMDANKDGKLALSEVKGPIANDFAKIDINGDGFITKEELEKAPKPSGQRPPRSQNGQNNQQAPPPNR